MRQCQWVSRADDLCLGCEAAYSLLGTGLIILVIPAARAMERKNERLLNILIDEKCDSHTQTGDFKKRVRKAG